MSKFLFVGISFRHQFIPNVEFQVVAVGTDYAFGKSDGFIPTSPVERRFEHDFIRRIALRFIETTGGLKFAEHVGDTVITDSVSTAKIRVCIVIERAPADTAGILRVGSKLVVDAGVAHGVFLKSFHLVDRFGGIGVADKFGVEITRMVRRFQREAEIVHGEYVFEEFRFLEITNSTGLTRGVELARQRVGASVEVMIVKRFVDAHAPENDAGMVPVSADHAADVVDGDQLPGFITDVLPAGNFFEDKEAHLVASVEKMTRLGVVRGTHDIALEFPPKDIRIASLTAARHSLSDKRKGLMTVEAAEFNDFAIEFETVFRE